MCCICGRYLKIPSFFRFFKNNNDVLQQRHTTGLAAEGYWAEAHFLANICLIVVMWIKTVTRFFTQLFSSPLFFPSLSALQNSGGVDVEGQYMPQQTQIKQLISCWSTKSQGSLSVSKVEFWIWTGLHMCEWDTVIFQWERELVWVNVLSLRIP